jgi:photosystem II stability/assembly factor-like uncharacterized protein
VVSISFSNNKVGCAVGINQTFFRTIDGGQNWSQLNNIPNVSYYDVIFIESEGWAVGENGTIIHSSNAGETWTPQISNTENALHAVCFTVNGLNGWAVGNNGTILYTSNGGATWYAQTSNVMSALMNVHFNNAYEGWAVGTGGAIVYTEDGGNKWINQSQEGNLNGVFAINENTCFACGNYNILFRTIDNGQTWEKLDPHIFPGDTGMYEYIQKFL